MKQSVIQILDFFKKHKYGKTSLILLLIGLVAFATVLLRSKPQQEPIPLSQVAAAISAGKVVKVQDSQNSGSLTIHYKDGSQSTTRRDQSASFLEQMQYLGVSDNQISKLHYEIVEKRATNWRENHEYTCERGDARVVGLRHVPDHWRSHVRYPQEIY